MNILHARFCREEFHILSKDISRSFVFRTLGVIKFVRPNILKLSKTTA